MFKPSSLVIFTPCCIKTYKKYYACFKPYTITHLLCYYA